MITGNTGGCIQRSMPPTDWNCGPIPEACYNPDLNKYQIAALLREVYLEEDRVKKLSNSDDPMSVLQSKIALEILADIDAETIWAYNAIQEH